jgi:hypothetical protein
MKNIIAFVSLFIVLQVTANQLLAQTGTVRGKLLQVSGTDTLTLSQIAVTLSDASENSTVPVYSGSDGIFVINEINAGTYVLEIWSNTMKKDPTRYKINVVYAPGNTYFDIAPIIVKKLMKKE